ncbi:anti-sigma factor (plasmid) [Streptomyces sp. NBC_01450]|uniref:anti-sigma factor family protein n=1 Tax=Streptomyces sp. NBC_01450 TaxID=2903871 RepID=UPI002E33833D|nr:anti-sigma factor [Streptomyces sp. NBC_01450]
MTAQGHSHDELLGAHALDLLTPDEQSRIEERIEACEVCQVELDDLRLLRADLGEVPPEFFLEGPPEDGELMLQRTMRQVREEQSVARRRRTLLIGLAAAALAGTLLGGGYVAGQAQRTARAPEAAAPRQQGPAVSDEGKSGSATDPGTKAKLSVRMTPAAGWVRVNAAVRGLPTGDRCTLVVYSGSGERAIAATWVVAEQQSAKADEVKLSGSAAVPLADATSVAVENQQGKRMVTVKL